MNIDFQATKTVIWVSGAILQFHWLIRWQLETGRNIACQTHRWGDVSQHFYLVNHGIRVLFAKRIRSLDAISMYRRTDVLLTQQR
ncbi:hypothetical protein SH501x_000519 [Pirellulaceae bacterium SH501]